MRGQGLRTGELAERAGVNVQTLRYQKRRGLLAAPTRRPSGQRQYPEGAVGLLRTIKAAQRLGCTLAEIEELLTLSEHRRGTGELQQRAKAKVAEIDAKIKQLTQMRQALLQLLSADDAGDRRCVSSMWPGWTFGAFGRMRPRSQWRGAHALQVRGRAAPAGAIPGPAL